MAWTVRCIAAILAKDEADRYLRQTIESLKPLCDKVLLLDDGSTDRTREMAWDLGCDVRERGKEAMWGNESPARQELWEWGSKEAGDGWLYIADADHETHADPITWRVMLSSWTVNAWALPLLDLWDSPKTYRVDGFWQGYKYPRPWLFKPSAVEGIWSERGIHCGHSPQGNWVVGQAPESCWIGHAGWLDAKDRATKHLRYSQKADILSEYELAHLNSALP